MSKRYEGPLKPGMKMRHRERAQGATVEAHAWGSSYEKTMREDFYPVRPADDDRDAWALFLPDAPLPDTGVKEIKVGQVWAIGAECLDARVVFRIDVINCGQVTSRGATALAGKIPGTMSPTGFFKFATLLFDTPDAATTAAPVKREQVGRNTCGLNVGGMSEGVACNKDPGHVGNCSWSLERGPRVLLPVAEPRIAICGRCAHRHIGPCPESSPGGHFSCPCGHATEAKRPRVEGLFPLGRGPRMEANDDEGKMWAQSGAGQTAREILLANLARERVPGRREIKVAARYAPGANLEEP